MRGRLVSASWRCLACSLGMQAGNTFGYGPHHHAAKQQHHPLMWCILGLARQRRPTHANGTTTSCSTRSAPCGSMRAGCIACIFSSILTAPHPPGCAHAMPHHGFALWIDASYGRTKPSARPRMRMQFIPWRIGYPGWQTTFFWWMTTPSLRTTSAPASGTMLRGSQSCALAAPSCRCIRTASRSLPTFRSPRPNGRGIITGSQSRVSTWCATSRPPTPDTTSLSNPT